MSAKTVKKARKQKPAADLSSIVLPDWLPEKTWGEFVEHRQQMRKPLTMLAATKTIAQFERYRDAGHDPVAIIDTSIANGWQGVFEPKTSAPHSRNLSVVERVAAAIQDRRQRESLAERSERKLREGDARDRLAAQGNVIEGAFTPVGPGYVPRETRSDAELMAEMKRRRPFMSSVTDEGKVYTGTPDEESPDSLTADWP